MAFSWTPPVNDGGSPINGYPIWWDKGIGVWEIYDSGNTATSYFITGLTANIGYKIKVVAKNSVGESTFSPEIAVTTLIISCTLI